MKSTIINGLIMAIHGFSELPRVAFLSLPIFLLVAYVLFGGIGVMTSVVLYAILFITISDAATIPEDFT